MIYGITDTLLSTSAISPQALTTALPRTEGKWGSERSSAQIKPVYLFHCCLSPFFFLITIMSMNAATHTEIPFKGVSARWKEWHKTHLS